VFQDQDELKCVGPLNGVTLWARNDVPVGCELFGDSELAFAADVGNHVAYVVRVRDGELLGKRDLPKNEWLITAGRNVAQISFNTSRNKRVIAITVTDIWSQKMVYQEEFPITARVSVIEPNAFAVFEPSGAFHLIDVESGRATVNRQLEPTNDLQAIQTLRFGDQLYLFISSHWQSQYKPIGHPSEYPLINGLVYAFSIKTGESLWPGPALVRNRGIVMQQPPDIPLLVFADRQLIRNSTSGGGSQLRVLCLDRRTGQTVYRNDALPDTSVTRFRIRGETDSRPIVDVEMSAGKIQLTMTDRPRPPQPPANDDLEAPRTTAERGLRGVGQQVSNALRGALERPVPNPVLQQRQLRVQPQPANRAAAPNAPTPAQPQSADTDDD